MKRVIILLTLLSAFNLLKAQDFGTFKDPRDGKEYKTIVIGNQIWMAENMAYRPKEGKFWAYDNNQRNVAKHGYLYNWETAKNVCPDGWHLPSDKEWKELQKFVQFISDGLKTVGEWGEDSYATNSLGFSAMSSGSFTNNGFRNMGKSAFWWSSNERNSDTAWAWAFDIHNRLARPKMYKSHGMSVRCIKD
ncbi:MAG: hypothetical protein CVT98_01945 [Bacteroidetes bacterium HGW-Bacteroidetes-15]|nr:MAG: hypothetical protein CVT98_01945 [Bacteroidetes bacterium HGW-Bacteroidetes-15]